MVDFDFIASAPTGFTNFVFCPIGLGYSFAIPDWVICVRIHTSTNKLEAKIGRGGALAQRTAAPNGGHVRPLSEGLPLPWPFP